MTELLRGVAEDARKCAEFYRANPGLAGAEAIIDLYAAIARLADAARYAKAEEDDPSCPVCQNGECTAGPGCYDLG